ncbi:MAG: efflux RND transporter permease subunit [Bacteroidales bacterium]|nr:efflux RND transporter permease subunit [Bacteroidales bacterium]
MSDLQKNKIKEREFRITTLALGNKSTIFILTTIIIVFGLFSFNNLPKELFPEVSFPTILIQTVYPGNAPVDMENLITRPLEKEIETVKGLKTLKSNSMQDVSIITAEFNSNADLDKALSDVKDAVDKAKSDLPNDLLTDPIVKDIDMSEFPIITINISGDFSIEELRNYAEFLQDEIESVSEISRVDIKGVNEKEIKIDVDLLKLQAYNISFFDIENAITAENISMSGGEIIQGNYQRSIRILGEFKNVTEIENVIIKMDKGQIVYLKDVADVIYGFKDPTNFARLYKDPVVSLQVVKKSGENLLIATDKIFAIMDQSKQSRAIPETLDIHYTNDQSDNVRKQLNNLVNNMIMGVLFVTLILFYFLGTRNALIVGLAIPLSMFTSFIVLSMLGYTINMIILFAMILALGMLVDNAIVVVENIYRLITLGYKPFEAARRGVGEVATPIITSTITTLAAFLPLAFWDSMVGKFMRMLPITLIIVLTSSLFVALVIIPVFSSTFIKIESEESFKKGRKKNLIAILGLVILAALGYFLKKYTIANLSAIFAVILFLNQAFFYRIGQWFQHKFLPWLESAYIKTLKYSLNGKSPWLFFSGTVVLLILTLIFFSMRSPNVLFFPNNEPSYINIVSELPIGTSIYATDSFSMKLEQDIENLLKPNKDIVKSVLTTVGKGSSDGITLGDEANKSIITIGFLDYQFRGGVKTTDIMARLSNELIGKYPGVLISFEKNDMGPPTGKPINIELIGKDFDKLIYLSDTVKNFIQKGNIPGIEGLKIDLDVGKPELIIHIDRDKARRFGLSTAQIAQNIRTSLFGKEISDFKVGEDEYPILIRLKDQYRYSISSLMNQDIYFKDDGKTIKVPLSSVATIQYSSTYGAVNRKDRKRVVTLYSNVVEGFNATKINQDISKILENFVMPEGYSFEFTGEQEEQQESMAFLMQAMLIAVSLILMILVTQFNSIIRPLIIMISVLFSTIGVFGGIATFKMDFIVVMMGIGIVSLAGIVVNNAIVLIDYIELLKERKREELGIEPGAFLPVDAATECVVQGGRTRLRPVLLTAITTVMGLISLAIGVNLDFGTMLSQFDPQFFVGGDMVAFWGPISWTVIFGLSFATFLTLIIVPVMYRLTIIMQKQFLKWFSPKSLSE